MRGLAGVITAFVLPALLASRDGDPRGGWSLLRTERDGITVESRAAAGTAMPELRVTTKAKHPPLELLESAWALRGDGMQTRYLVERTVLSSEASERVLLLRYAPPAISERAVALRELRWRDPKTGAASMTFNQLHAHPSARAAGTPFAHLRGHWSFEPNTEGTQVVYTVLIDVGGVPAVLARSAQERAAVDTVREVVARAHRP
ncbi:MAG: hypothetical protein JNK82_01085 [Myxococcaceae bacterium]|nr:hypothetical protein [Myxococcaceae bacterium]